MTWRFVCGRGREFRSPDMFGWLVHQRPGGMFSVIRLLGHTILFSTDRWWIWSRRLQRLAPRALRHHAARRNRTRSRASCMPDDSYNMSSSVLAGQRLVELTGARLVTLDGHYAPRYLALDGGVPPSPSSTGAIMPTG